MRRNFGSTAALPSQLFWRGSGPVSRAYQMLILETTGERLNIADTYTQLREGCAMALCSQMPVSDPGYGGGLFKIIDDIVQRL